MAFDSSDKFGNSGSGTLGSSAIGHAFRSSDLSAIQPQAANLIQQRQERINSFLLGTLDDPTKELRKMKYRENDAVSIIEAYRQEYIGNEDFDTEMSKRTLAKALHEAVPYLSEDYFYRNGSLFMKTATGYDDKPKNYLQHLGRTVSSAAESLAGSIALAGYYGSTLFGGGSSVAKEDLLAWVRSNGSQYNRGYGDDRWWYMRPISEAAAQLPQMLTTGTLMLIGAATGTLGGTAGAVLPVLLKGSAMLTTGMMEAGDTMFEMAERGFSDEAVLTAGTLVGLFNGVLEYASDSVVFDPIAKMIKSGAKKVGAKAASGTIRSALGKTLESLGSLFGRHPVLTNMLASETTETLTEIGQTWSSMFAENMALNIAHSNGQLLDLQTYTMDDYAEAFKETAIATLLSTGVFSLGSNGIALLGNRYLNRDQRQANRHTTATEGAKTVDADRIFAQNGYSFKASNSAASFSENPNGKYRGSVHVRSVGGRTYISPDADDAQKRAVMDSRRVWAVYDDFSAERALEGVEEKRSIDLGTASPEQIREALQRGYESGELLGYTWYDDGKKAGIVTKQHPDTVQYLTAGSRMQSSVYTLLYGKSQTQTGTRGQSTAGNAESGGTEREERHGRNESPKTRPMSNRRMGQLIRNSLFVEFDAATISKFDRDVLNLSPTEIAGKYSMTETTAREATEKYIAYRKSHARRGETFTAKDGTSVHLLDVYGKDDVMEQLSNYFSREEVDYSKLPVKAEDMEGFSKWYMGLDLGESTAAASASMSANGDFDEDEDVGMSADEEAEREEAQASNEGMEGETAEEAMSAESPDETAGISPNGEMGTEESAEEGLTEEPLEGDNAEYAGGENGEQGESEPDQSGESEEDVRVQGSYEEEDGLAKQSSFSEGLDDERGDTGLHRQESSSVRRERQELQEGSNRNISREIRPLDGVVLRGRSGLNQRLRERLSEALKNNTEANYQLTDLYEITGEKDAGRIFHELIEKAKSNQDFGAYVYTYPIDSVTDENGEVEDGYNSENMRLFISEDGMSGFALHKKAETTDIVSVFSNKASGKHGTIVSILATAIENGGRTLDCYVGSGLVTQYQRMGFKIAGWCDYDEDNASDGVKEIARNLHVTPDVVAMYWGDASIEETIDKWAERYSAIDKESEAERYKATESFGLSHEGYDAYKELLKSRDGKYLARAAEIEGVSDPSSKKAEMEDTTPSDIKEKVAGIKETAKNKRNEKRRSERSETDGGSQSSELTAEDKAAALEADLEEVQRLKGEKIADKAAANAIGDFYEYWLRKGNRLSEMQESLSWDSANRLVREMQEDRGDWASQIAEAIGTLKGIGFISKSVENEVPHVTVRTLDGRQVRSVSRKLGYIAAQRIAGGDYPVTLSEESGKAIDSLIDTFLTMAKRMDEDGAAISQSMGEAVRRGFERLLPEELGDTSADTSADTSVSGTETLQAEPNQPTVTVPEEETVSGTNTETSDETPEQASEQAETPTAETSEETAAETAEERLERVISEMREDVDRLYPSDEEFAPHRAALKAAYERLIRLQAKYGDGDTDSEGFYKRAQDSALFDPSEKGSLISILTGRSGATKIKQLLPMYGEALSSNDGAALPAEFMELIRKTSVGKSGDKLANILADRYADNYIPHTENEMFMGVLDGLIGALADAGNAYMEAGGRDRISPLAETIAKRGVKEYKPPKNSYEVIDGSGESGDNAEGNGSENAAEFGDKDFDTYYEELLRSSMNTEDANGVKRFGKLYWTDDSGNRHVVRTNLSRYLYNGLKSSGISKADADLMARLIDNWSPDVLNRVFSASGDDAFTIASLRRTLGEQYGIPRSKTPNASGVSMPAGEDGNAVRIVIDKGKGSLETVLHECFHAIMDMDSGYRDEVIGAVRAAFANEKDKKTLSSFVTKYGKHINERVPEGYEHHRLTMESLAHATEKGFDYSTDESFRESIARLYEAWVLYGRKDRLSLPERIRAVFSRMRRWVGKVFRIIPHDEGGYVPKGIETAFARTFGDLSQMIEDYGPDISYMEAASPVEEAFRNEGLKRPKATAERVDTVLAEAYIRSQNESGMGMRKTRLRSTESSYTEHLYNEYWKDMGMEGKGFFDTSEGGAYSRNFILYSGTLDIEGFRDFLEDRGYFRSLREQYMRDGRFESGKEQAQYYRLTHLIAQNIADSEESYANIFRKLKRVCDYKGAKDYAGHSEEYEALASDFLTSIDTMFRRLELKEQNLKSYLQQETGGVTRSFRSRMIRYADSNGISRDSMNSFLNIIEHSAQFRDRLIRGDRAVLSEDGKLDRSGWLREGNEIFGYDEEAEREHRGYTLWRNAETAIGIFRDVFMRESVEGDTDTYSLRIAPDGKGNIGGPLVEFLNYMHPTEQVGASAFNNARPEYIAQGLIELEDEVYQGRISADGGDRLLAVMDIKGLESDLKSAFGEKWIAKAFGLDLKNSPIEDSEGVRSVLDVFTERVSMTKRQHEELLERLNELDGVSEDAESAIAQEEETETAEGTETTESAEETEAAEGTESAEGTEKAKSAREDRRREKEEARRAKYEESLRRIRELTKELRAEKGLSKGLQSRVARLESLLDRARSESSERQALQRDTIRALKAQLKELRKSMREETLSLESMLLSEMEFIEETNWLTNRYADIQSKLDREISTKLQSMDSMMGRELKSVFNILKRGKGSGMAADYTMPETAAILQKAESFGMVRFSRDRSSFAAVKALDGIPLEELAELLYDFEDCISIAKSKEMRRKLQMEAEANDERENIIRGFFSQKGKSPEQVEDYLRQYRESPSKGEESAKRSRLDIFSDFHLMSLEIKRQNPALYAYLFGGVVDGKKVTDSLNDLYNAEYSGKQARISSFYRKVSSVFSIKGKRVPERLEGLFMGKRTTLGRMDAEEFMRTNPTAKWGIRRDPVTGERVPLREFVTPDGEHVRMDRRYQALAEFTATLEDRIANAEESEDTDEADRLEEIMNGVHSSALYDMNSLMAIYMHAQTGTGLSRLIFGNGIGLGDILWVMNEFDSNPEWAPYREIADYMMEDLSGQYERIARVYRSVNGKELGHIDRYFPAVGTDYVESLDSGISIGSFMEDLETVQPLSGNMRESFLKGRVTNQKRLSLDSVQIYTRTLENQEHYVAFAEKLDKMDRIINKSERLRDAAYASMGQHKGEVFMRQLVTMLENVRGVNPKESDTMRLFMAIRNNYTVAKLWGSITSCLQQFPTFLLTLAKVGAKHTFGSLVQYMRHPREMQEMIYRKAPQMAERARLEISDARRARHMHMGRAEQFINDRFGKNVTSGGKAFLRKAADLGLSMMEASDKAVANSMWLAYYGQIVEDRSAERSTVYAALSDEEFDQMCANEATQLVMDISPTANPKDNAPIYMNRDNYISRLLVFTNQVNKQYNMVRDAFIKNGRNTRDYLANLFRTLTVMGLVLAGTAFISGSFLGGDDDDDGETMDDSLKRFLTKSVWAEWAGMAPLIGTQMKDIISGQIYSDEKFSGAVANLIKVLGKEPDERTDHQLANAWVSIVADTMTFVGYPSNFTEKAWRAIKEKDWRYLINSSWPKWSNPD